MCGVRCRTSSSIPTPQTGSLPASSTRTTRLPAGVTWCACSTPRRSGNNSSRSPHAARWRAWLLPSSGCGVTATEVRQGRTLRRGRRRGTLAVACAAATLTIAAGSAVAATHPDTARRLAASMLARVGAGSSELRHRSVANPLAPATPAEAHRAAHHLSGRAEHARQDGLHRRPHRPPHRPRRRARRSRRSPAAARATPATRPRTGKGAKKPRWSAGGGKSAAHASRRDSRSVGDRRQTKSR